jgi:sigma-B regulation protein RsbU (phosphoserine phosphatase)
MVCASPADSAHRCRNAIGIEAYNNVMRSWYLCRAAGLLLLASVPGVASATDWQADIVPLADGWRALVVVHEHEPAAPPDESDALVGATPDEIDSWHSVSVPASVQGPRELVFSCYQARVEVWVDNDVEYRFELPEAEGRLSVHSVHLDDPGERLLSLRFPLLGGGSLVESAPLLARPETAPAARVRLSADPLLRDLARVVAAAILVIVGFGSVAVGAVRWRRRQRAVLWFGLMAGLYGVRLLVDTAVAPLLGMTQSTRWYLMSLISYVINVPAALFAVEVIGRGWRSSLLWVARAAMVLAAAGVLADAAMRTPFAASAWNNWFVLLSALVLVVNLARWQGLRSSDGVVLTAGLLVFGLFAVFENVRGLSGALDWSEHTEWVGFFALTAAFGWVALRRFVDRETELVGIRKELGMARAIQASILPRRSPASDGLEISARYVPMTAVAGDFYDYIELPDGRLGVLIADVSGHGVPAAMVASMVKVAVSTHAEECPEPAELVASVNRTLCRHLGREFVTMSCIVFDPAAMTARVCNAGHPPPLRLSNGAVRPLGELGVLLGKFARATYSAATVGLEAGDRILCFTDGITEARSAGGEQFGSERLEAVLASSSGLDLDGMLDAVLAEVEGWTGRAAQSDDLTLVAIDVARSPSPVGA